MTGEEMERAIEFLLQNQATLEECIEQVNRDLGGRIAELAAAVRMQADSQSQFNQTLTTAVTVLAEAQSSPPGQKWPGFSFVAEGAKAATKC